MGKLQVNGDISATGTISASSFLGNASSATYTYQFRTSATNPCTASTDSNTGIFNVPDSRIYWISQTGTVIDQLNQWGYILDIGTNAERHQIWMTQSSGDMAHRGGNAANGWSSTWRILLDSSNYISYVPTKTGSGASGTWAINITGSAASASSVAWSGVTGKPSTFPPSSHTHDYVPYGVKHSGVNFNTITNSGFHRVNSGNTNGPSVSDWGQLLVIHGGGDTITQIYGDYSSGNLFTRSGNPPDVGGVGSWTSWKKLLNSDNYSSYCLPLSGGTMTGRITLASTGFQTNNVAGYYLDQYGNFFHSRASTGDHWQFHSYDQSISLKYYADTGDLLVPHIMKTQSITLTSTGAISFYGAGSGTYNCSMIYVDTTHGFQIETPRLTDSASGTILPCKILTRGGAPAPIHYSYAVSTNYGTGIPGTSTPGYGIVGAIYYKI